MQRKANRAARTVVLIGEDMENMAGSEWTVRLLATRRKDGSLTLKVHQRSDDHGLEYLYRSAPIRTADALIASWLEALEEGCLASGDDTECIEMLVDEALPALESLHSELAGRLRADARVRHWSTRSPRS